MNRVIWKPLGSIYCDQVQAEVALEGKLVFPSEVLPDPAPRVLAHRCSQRMRCDEFEKQNCAWASALPEHDALA